MTVANTSIEAYDAHKAAGKVGAQANMILGIMNSSQNYSRREIARLAGIELSSVCGRVNELLEVGLLVEDPKRKCSVTGKTINPVRTRIEDDTNCNLTLF
jgi:predicted transcriptional regulator